MPERYHHGDLQAALVDGALRILDAERLEALSLRRVAREAGVSHAAPYHHFADLDALLAAVAARGFRILREEISDRATAAEEDPFVRLQAAGTAYVRFAVTHPELFRLMFGGRLSDTTAYPALHAAGVLTFESLRRLVVGALGPPNAASAAPAARTAWALVHGIAMLLVDGAIELPPGEEAIASAERLTREMTSVLGRGLRSL